MTQGLYEIRSNVKIARDVYEMTLSGDTSAVTTPGQFINIKLDGFFSPPSDFGLRLGCADAHDPL